MFLKKILSLPFRIRDFYIYASAESERMANLRNSQKGLSHLGKGTKIESQVYITHPKRVRFGDHCTVQNRVLLHSVGGIHVGDYVGIGYGTLIVTFVHNYNYCSSIPYDNVISLKPVVIRDFAWIGWNCIINPGLEIGEGAIIGMGAVLNKDVPPLAIMMGNPAEVIGYRSKEHYDKCKSEGRRNSHRILETFGAFNEKIPLMIKRKYAKELRDLGIG